MCKNFVAGRDPHTQTQTNNQHAQGEYAYAYVTAAYFSTPRRPPDATPPGNAAAMLAITILILSIPLLSAFIFT
jgi:hypothetical protein